MAANGISATAIALIVCLGLIPAIILIWVVIWLMFFYANDRTCCCTKRKRKNKEEEEWLGEQRAETLGEKTVNTLPPQPSNTHQRTDSEYVARNGRLTKVSKVDTRMSMQSQASASTVQVAHEPKPFV